MTNPQPECYRKIQEGKLSPTSKGNTMMKLHKQEMNLLWPGAETFEMD